METIPNKFLKSLLLCVLLLTALNCAGTNIRLGSLSEHRVPGRLKFIGFIGEGSLKRPLGLTTDPWGNLYIADSGDNRVKKFDSQGMLLDETEGYGQGGGRFSHPVDLSFGGDLKLYLLDGLKGEVQALDRDLGFLFSIGKGSEGDSPLSFPSGLALDRSGRIFVIDSRQDGLFLLSPEGEFQRFYSPSGTILKPMDIAVDSQDRIYVTDGTGRLLVFDFVGALIGTIGEGILIGPMGVAIDGAGNIWVSEQPSRSIFLFSPQGELMEEYPLPFPPGKLEISPTDKKLWVVDQSEARVAVYQIGQ